LQEVDLPVHFVPLYPLPYSFDGCAVSDLNAEPDQPSHPHGSHGMVS
jgi:hypothetical protein